MDEKILKNTLVYYAFQKIGFFHFPNRLLKNAFLLIKALICGNCC